MLRKKIIISNKLGLHARASAKLVALGARYSSQIYLKRGDKEVNGKSIMGVMMLAANNGVELELITEGEDEQETMDALVNLINDKFGEKR